VDEEEEEEAMAASGGELEVEVGVKRAVMSLSLKLS
jgi:hypothetical protein